MLIYVRLAEPFWRAVGRRDLELDLNDSTRIADLLGLLQAQYPALEQEMVEAPPQIFIDEAETSPDTLLTEGARVHLVWAVAGG